MKLRTTPRSPGEIPVGAFAMLPLFALPLGAWLVETGTLNLSMCGFKRAFDLPCLSCGSTRATVNLLHGNFGTALYYQPMTMMLYMLLILWGSLSIWALLKGHRLHLDMSKREDFAVKAAFVAIPIVNWGYLVSMGI